MRRSLTTITLLTATLVVAALAAYTGGKAQAGPAPGPAALPPQVHFADRMVDELPVPSADNEYDGDPVIVEWAGDPGVAKTRNRSTCAPFITRLMRRAYSWSEEQYQEWFGSRSPNSARYRERLAAGAGPFRPVAKVASLLPGDIIAIDYQSGGSAVTGHVMMVRAQPIEITPSSPVIEGPGGTPLRQYAISVIDSSSSYHGDADTRVHAGGVQKGVGRGTARLYAATDGTIAGYTWSTKSASTYYSRSSRPIVAARVGGDATAPRLAVRKRGRAKRGRGRITVRCTGAACRGKAQLTTRSGQRLSRAARVRLANGAKRRLAVRLTRSARKRLASRGRLRGVLRSTLEGSERSASARVVLRG